MASTTPNESIAVDNGGTTHELAEILETHGITDAEVAAAQGAAGGQDCFVMKTVPIIWRAAKGIELDRFIDEGGADEKHRSKAMKTFAANLIVHPPMGPVRAAVLEKFRGALLDITGDATALSRGKAVDESRKL